MPELEFSNLRSALDDRYSPEDVQLVERAFEYEKMAHTGQARHTGEPYFAHCANVGKKLALLRLPSEVIAAGSVEDTRQVRIDETPSTNVLVA